MNYNMNCYRLHNIQKEQVSFSLFCLCFKTKYILHNHWVHCIWNHHECNDCSKLFCVWWKMFFLTVHKVHSLLCMCVVWIESRHTSIMLALSCDLLCQPNVWSLTFTNMLTLLLWLHWVFSLCESRSCWCWFAWCVFGHATYLMYSFSYAVD